MNPEECASQKAFVADEIAWRGQLPLEDYLDIEFSLLRVTPHIVHIRAHTEVVGFPSAVTLATVEPVDVGAVRYSLGVIEDGDGCKSMASRMKQVLESDGSAGVAVCDYRDQFSRKRGRIIAKGRLLKLLRKQEVSGA